MAISKVKLPDNSSQELHDYRISGVDSSPSSGSGNVVTSGGVYTALAGKVGSSSVSTIVSLTQAQYNALTTKDANTAYIITDAQSSGGTTEVFWATYGTTTFALVDAAYQAGKLVLVDYGGFTYIVGAHDDGTYYTFYMVTVSDPQASISELYLEDDDTWDVRSVSSVDADYVYDAVHPAVQTAEPFGGMWPNTLYRLGTLTGAVTFTLGTPSDPDIVNHYYWTFETGSTAPTITWPAAITKWNGGSAPTIAANKHYEVSVLDGVAAIMEA